MKLKQQNLLPSVVQARLRIRQAKQHAAKRGKQFRVLVCKFAPAVIFLVAGNGGVCPAVHFEVKFAAPHRQMRVVLRRSSMVQKFRRRSDSCVWAFAEAVFHSAAQFKHLHGRATAAVSKAEGIHHLIRKFLLLKAIPCTCYHIRIVVGNISCKIRWFFAALFWLCGKKIAENFSAVNSAPVEHVIRHLIGFVPANFGGDKTVDTAFFQNLGQCSRIAEYIRQPEHTALHPELLFKKPFAEQHLPHKALAGRQVTVGLHPHGAFHLPPAGGDHFFDFLIGFGAFLFQIIIKLRL